MKDKTKSRIVFIVRLLSWLIIGCVIPITVFAVKFGLFEITKTVVDELGNPIVKESLSLNGWGIVSCIIVGSFLTYIVKDVADAYTGYSMVKQCYKGFISTMPLIIAFAVCYFLKGVIDQVMFCLIVIIICKLIATPINPIPKWKFEKRGEEDYSGMTEALTKFVKGFEKGGD